MGKAAIIDPYLDTMGGGERYSLSFAKVLSDLGYQVDVEWEDVEIRERLEDRFGMDFKDLNFIPNTNKGDGYDICFWVSDGSIPLLHGRHNILHFQVPFQDVNGGSLFNKMKLYRVNGIICNSEFTKKIIDEEYGVKSKVIYPPVSVDKIISKRKEKIILSVGRFSNLLQSKNQHLLIKNFKRLEKRELTDWKLVLAGGIEVGADSYIKEIKNSLGDSAIEIIESPDFKTLKDLYGKARIFWSASGFGQDEEKNPKLVEHFGITTVEAMAAGAVPVVYAAGGVREIIEDGKDGFLWNKESELINKTERLVSGNASMYQISQVAKKSSERFSYEKFRENVQNIL